LREVRSGCSDEVCGKGDPDQVRSLRLIQHATRHLDASPSTGTLVIVSGFEIRAERLRLAAIEIVAAWDAEGVLASVVLVSVVLAAVVLASVVLPDPLSRLG
jgi:hypothetical protein